MRLVLLLIALCSAPAVASAQWGIHAAFTESDEPGFQGMRGLSLRHDARLMSRFRWHLSGSYLTALHRYYDSLCFGLLPVEACTMEDIEERVSFMGPALGLSGDIYATAMTQFAVGVELRLGFARSRATGATTNEVRRDNDHMLGTSLDLSLRRMLSRGGWLAAELGAARTSFSSIAPVVYDGYSAFGPGADITTVRLGLVFLPRH